MPGIDGIEATRRIMGESPCAILVVTSTVTGHLSKVYQAMGYGALDAARHADIRHSGAKRRRALLLHKIDIIGKLVGKPAEPVRGGRDMAVFSFPSAPPAHTLMSLEPLIVLGASTGGPNALAEVLTHLPVTLKAAIIIVQHVDAVFAPGLGQWLSEQAQRRVTLVVEGHRPVASEILLLRHR